MIFLGIVLSHALLPAPKISTAGADITCIGEKLGKSVRIQAALSKKLLFISNPDIPPDRLLALVSLAVHGSVRATPNGLILERSPKDLANLREAERKERAGWIQERLASVAEYRKKASLGGGGFAQVLTRELSGKEAAVQKFSSHTGPRPATFFPTLLLPSEQMLEGLIRRIGIDELASIQPGRTEVYESFPVDEARLLPGCDDLVDQYVEATGQFEGLTLPLDASDAIQKLNYGPYFSQLGKHVKRPERLRLRIAVSRTDQVIELEGFDLDQRRVLLAHFVTLGPVQGVPYTSLAFDDLRSVDAQWSPISKPAQAEIDRDLKRNTLAGGPVPDWLVHPERSEPLNAFVYDCLKAFASRTPNKCTIVDVDDFFWLFSRLCCSEGRLCTTAFQDELNGIEDYERVEDATSIVLRPRTPESVEGAQADRNVLGRHLRDLIAQKGDRLRTLSLLFHDTSGERSVLAEAFARDAMRIGSTSPDNFLGDMTYRFLGGICDDVWSDVMAGRTVTVSQANATNDMRDLLVSEILPATGEEPVSDLKHHPIELYSKALVGDTLVSVPSRDLSVIRWQTSDGRLSRWQSVERLTSMAPAAVHILSGGNIGLSCTQDAFDQRFGWDWVFQTASETQRKIIIHLPDGQRMEILASTVVHDPSPLGAYRELPQGLRDMVWRDSIDAQTKQLAALFSKHGSDDQPPARKVPPP